MGNECQSVPFCQKSHSRYLQDSQKKTTVLERHETVKTGENMAESAYFFVTLQQNCNV